MAGMTSILWRRLDTPGHEFARIAGRTLSGTALFLHDGAPVRLAYEITCDRAWNTRRCRVRGFVGPKRIGIDFTAPWEGCIDVDLNFSPATNTLPIRRLDLAIGASADVRAAWLRFPSFHLEVLEQRYTRLTEKTFRYESAGGSFVREIEVNDIGLITRYPGFFEEERG